MDANHGANEFRKKVSGSDTARNKGTFKTHKNLLPFLQILWIDAASSVGGCIAECLHILTRVPQNPKRKDNQEMKTLVGKNLM